MQNAGLNSAFENPLAQQLRECVSKPLIQISALNTSLVEQTAAGLALGGSRNLTSAFDYIGHDRIGKTSVRIFGAFVSVRTVTIPFSRNALPSIECTR